MTTDIDLAKQIEREAIDKLWKYLESFSKFERPIQVIMRRKYSPEEIMEAEGKRCVIAVRGLRYNDLILFFEISNLSIKQVEPFENYNTWIEAPIKVINLFLGRILSGDEEAFGDLITGNDVKIKGPHSFHDIHIFEDVTRTLAQNIKQIKAVMK
jgi:hypothetical protein